VEGGTEGMGAVIAAGEGIGTGQGGRLGGAGEGDGAAIAGDGVAVGVHGGDAEAGRRAGQGRRRETTDAQRTGRVWVDDDARLGTGVAGRRRIGGGEGLAAGGLEGGREAMHAVI